MSHPRKTHVRKARVKDVSIIAEIINGYAEKGLMLPRPISRIYDNVRDYDVIEIDGEIVGCGALHVTWSDLAEIRAIALKDDYRGKGYGKLLVETLLKEAEGLGVEKVFVLTYNKGLFEHLGFTVIDKSELPHKIWTECINCIHFPNCDEIALIRPVKITQPVQE